MGPSRDELYGKQNGLMPPSLGILADDSVREAFIDECARQNEWKRSVDEVMKVNAKKRISRRKESTTSDV